jgi:hypothetical protein
VDKGVKPRKRYLLAVVGLETNAIVPLTFHGFWRRRTAEAKCYSLNCSSYRGGLTRYAVYDRRYHGLVA